MISDLVVDSVVKDVFDNRQGRGGGRNGAGRGGRGGRDQQGRSRNDFGRRPRFPPPAEGESEIKIVNGTRWYWCAKGCGWNRTHGTDQHKTREELQRERERQNNQANLADAQVPRHDFDVLPAAFMASVEDPKYENLYLNELSVSQSAMLSGGPTQDTSTPHVLIDSGANCCITNNRDDFIRTMTTYGTPALVEGLGKGLKIVGKGTVRWGLKSDNGSTRWIDVPCLYIPTAVTRILSTAVYLRRYPHETIGLDATGLIISGSNGQAELVVTNNERDLPMAPLVLPSLNQRTSGRSHNPIVLTAIAPPAPRLSESSSTTAVDEALIGPTQQPSRSLVSAHNINLTDPEKELLRWHYKLGHISLKRILWMFRQGFLSNSERQRRLQMRACQLTRGPLCTACQYAKMKRRPTPGSLTKVIPTQVGALSRNKLFPGQMVSVDHFHSNPKGRLLDTYGKEADDKRFVGGCIFVDHASSYVHVEFQPSLSAHYTLRAKTDFETLCSSLGVVV